MAHSSYFRMVGHCLMLSLLAGSGRFWQVRKFQGTFPATVGARRGIPDHLMQALGRWPSNAYKSYICTPSETLASLFSSDLWAPWSLRLVVSDRFLDGLQVVIWCGDSRSSSCPSNCSASPCRDMAADFGDHASITLGSPPCTF